MTKIQCDLSGVPILDARFVIKVVDAITQARNTDSQAVSLDADTGAKLIDLCLYFGVRFRGDIDARDDIMQGPDPAKEFAKRDFQSDLAMLHMMFQIIAGMRKYVEPTGLSSVDQMLWDRAAESSRKVQQWSAKGGMAEDHGLPAILFCTSCRTFFAHSKKGVQSGIMDCRKCGTKTNHVRLEERYAAGVDQP